MEKQQSFSVMHYGGSIVSDVACKVANAINLDRERGEKKEMANLLDNPAPRGNAPQVYLQGDGGAGEDGHEASEKDRELHLEGIVDVEHVDR